MHYKPKVTTTQQTTKYITRTFNPKHLFNIDCSWNTCTTQTETINSYIQNDNVVTTVTMSFSTPLNKVIKMNKQEDIKDWSLKEDELEVVTTLEVEK